VRAWCRERSFNWKWTFALAAVVLVCGTALFIYLGWKSETRAQAKRRNEQDVQQTAAESQKAYWLQQIASQQEKAEDPIIKQSEGIAKEHEAIENEQRLNDLAIKTWDPFWQKHHRNLSSGGGIYSGDPSDFEKLKALLRSGMTPDAARSQLEDELKRRRDMEEVKTELRRANALAEEAAFQHQMDKLDVDRRRRMDKLDADTAKDQAVSRRRIDKLDADRQRQADKWDAKLEADRQRLAQEISQPQASEWVLKYNSFSGQYQYVPPTAQLKYNPFQKRWEWVP
jgi:hypothetical protein